MKTYTKTQIMIELGIPNQPHLLDQWVAKGIIAPKKKKNGDRIYNSNHLQRLKEYKILRDSLKEWY